MRTIFCKAIISSMLLTQVGISQAQSLSESICGAQNDSNYINNISQRLGTPLRLILQRAPSVGALAYDRQPGFGSKFCSGTLISENLFLTAAHCREVFTSETVVSFNYEYERGMGSIKTEDFHAVEEVVEDGQKLPANLDYLVVRLSGTPGNTYGITPIRAVEPKTGERVEIIQHPQGLPKKVHGATISTLDGSLINYNALDTEGGSSGSGVLDSSGNLIGVHVLGGCSSSGGENSATSMKAILQQSVLLRSLAR